MNDETKELADTSDLGVVEVPAGTNVEAGDHGAEDTLSPTVGASQELDSETHDDVSESPEKAKPEPDNGKSAEGGQDELVLTPEQAALPWYVVTTFSGFENRAKTTLEDRIVKHNMQAKFGRVLMPQETVVELVRGTKKSSKRKFFPGYILVQMKLDDESWHLVKETPKINGFVGDSRDPLPLSPQEVENLMAQLEGGGRRTRTTASYEQGDAVKVVDGPFADFNGTVDEVRADKGKLRVLISIFGRNTPVELDFLQVEKV